MKGGVGVRPHPETGRKALFFNRLIMLWIEDVERASSISASPWAN
jgi:hypothetical protein